jgi:hypothetical protein
MGIPEGEEQSKGIENLFHEIMAKHFPNLQRDMDIQIQET